MDFRPLLDPFRLTICDKDCLSLKSLFKGFEVPKKKLENILM